ncbi:PriCT-2 domain-containing protein, partial [uncultured Bacteroides sp.]|uniref:PriCT-2 domain-containing protein n=1 Tax=uncultured Bacteroides sp. TaxID=162156 RepID=UPI0026776389
MTDIESLRRLTEAVETAGADIAPTYLEYIQLSFAIATDCGESGRDFFHRLCRVSPKYQREHAERVFSNALHTQRGEVHLGTAFHLAEAMGVSICIKEMSQRPAGTKSTADTVRKSSTHTCAHNKVGNNKISEEREGEEELLPGSEPQHQLPTFPENDWPEFLQRI